MYIKWYDESMMCTNDWVGLSNAPYKSIFDKAPPSLELSLLWNFKLDCNWQRPIRQFYDLCIPTPKVGFSFDDHHPWEITRILVQGYQPTTFPLTSTYRTCTG